MADAVAAALSTNPTEGQVVDAAAGKAANPVRVNPLAKLKKHREGEGVQLSGREGMVHYPATYVRSTEEDDDMATRTALADQTPFDKIPLDDKTLRYFKSKDEALEEYQFEDWFARSFNLRDPSIRDLALKINPEFFKRREEYFDRQMSTVKRFFDINSYGIRTAEDVMFAYALAKGVVKMPAPRFWMPSQGNATTAEEFQRGLFNPFRSGAYARPMGTRGLGADLLRGFGPERRAPGLLPNPERGPDVAKLRAAGARLGLGNA